MDKKELQKKLNKPYSTDNWREVVQFVFPNVQILNPPMVIPIDNEKVEQFRQLGNVQLHDGKSLALFELKLKENVNILRNRVELNNLVSQYIDQDQTHGVLSIFEKGGNDYRFTFSASASEFDEEEGDFVTKKTDTKRFTYVLGKNESCKTPAQRFYELSENKNKAEIKDIENAFSVEKLSKAFFKEYKDQYTTFVNYMMQTPGIFKAIYSEDDKAIRDFVKILLGRIIFIKFVQKKGWMGVDAASKKWENGDFRFIENGFANFKHQDLFYSTFLEPLFEALDEPNRPNDIFTVTNTRVPYLSGGLFELEDKKTKNINFPAKYFNDLFEFLDRYNFTIDENDTNDHEVGIDPEMLGHIFENLLEDNKDKGAFYTPKEIVRYMCQESLKEYLKTSLENNKQWPTDETEAKDFEQALHNFVTKKEAGGIIEFEETIARALKEVKICDPAIGSGAFPMGLLNEIFQLVHKLHEANKDKVERVWELKGWQPNLVKQNIIQNSIYGVDIEKGAVDVARLRFWLSLIVDEPEPKALPHLDYKIVVGNSLVSKLDDTIIYIDWDVKEEQTDLFGNENKERQQQLLKEISAKQILVFDPNSNEEKLSLEIRNLKIDLLINQLDAMVKTKGVAVKPTGTGKTIKAQTELWLETIGWKQQIEKLQKIRKDLNGILHFFDWKLDFPEIMSEEVTKQFNRKVGFDIVIGNPPYIKENTNKSAFNGFRKSDYYQGKMDLWYGFSCMMIDNLKSNGIQCFIATNNWITSDGASKLRFKILSDTEIKSFVDFGNYKVFQSAGIQTMIYVVQKKKYEAPYKLKYSVLTDDKIIQNKLNDFLNFDLQNEFAQKYIFEVTDDMISDKSFTFNTNDFELLLNEILKKSNFKLLKNEILSGIDIPQDFLSKSSAKLLGDGFSTGMGVFVLSQEELENLNLNEEEKSLLKPFYTTTEMKRYKCDEKNQYWIIYTDSKFKNTSSMDNYPRLKAHLDKFQKIITSENKPYGLNRARKDGISFLGEKIIATRKSVGKPIFTYTNFDTYFSRTFMQIICLRVNNKFLTALLNSKIIEFWLRNKGKMQGNNFQLDKEPLLNIPLLVPNDVTKFTILVDYLLYLNNPNIEQILSHTDNKRIANHIEDILNVMVNELYFEKHMKDNKIDVLEYLNPKSIESLNNSEQSEIIKNFYLWYQEPQNPVRQAIMLVDTKSKDILVKINKNSY